MSETEPRSPAMLLQAAARLAPFPVKDGWPESLTPAQLAKLQYPNEGDLQERKRAIPLRNDFANLVHAAIAAGKLLTVAVERKADAQQGVSTIHAANGLGSPEWRNEQFATSSAPPVEKAASSTVQAITRTACASWFSATREIPRSDYVRAWLADEWNDDKPASVKGKTGRPSDLKKKQGVVLAIVKAFEEVMGQFKSSKLPAPKKDFIDACRRLEKAKTDKAVLFGTVTAATVTTWLKPSGYQFATGTPSGVKNPYTSKLPAITDKISADVFTKKL